MAEEKRNSEFGHLYHQDAPWTGLSGGEDFVEYLRKMKATGKEKELVDEEKECLKKLEKWEKENGDEKGSEGAGVVTPNEAKIPWKLLASPGNIIYYLYGEPQETEFNQNIIAVLNDLKGQGMSILEMSEFAEAKCNEIKQNYINEKQEEMRDLQGANPIEKVGYKLSKISGNYFEPKSEPSLFFKFSVKTALKNGTLNTLGSENSDKKPENQSEAERETEEHQDKQGQPEDAERKKEDEGEEKAMD